MMTVDAAYVFRRSGTTWTEQAKLMAVDGVAGDRFGVSVAIDEDTIVVGSDSGHNGDGTGSTYVYIPSGTSWSQQAKLKASDGVAGDWFGWSLTIGGDTIVVGSINADNDNGAPSGSAYVFMRTETAWSQQMKFAASDGAANDRFAVSVAISNHTIVVGACYSDDDIVIDSGSAYVYELN